jgi:hypothetical protein
MSDFKQKKWLCLLTVVFLMASRTVVLAHPPKEVSLGWNPSGVLTLNVAHSVDNPEKHYIYKVVVYADNKMIATKDYKAQTSADGLADAFSLGALSGGTNLKVEVFCVIMGSALGSMVVP